MLPPFRRPFAWRETTRREKSPDFERFSRHRERSGTEPVIHFGDGSVYETEGIGSKCGKKRSIKRESVVAPRINESDDGHLHGQLGTIVIEKIGSCIKDVPPDSLFGVTAVVFVLEVPCFPVVLFLD